MARRASFQYPTQGHHWDSELESLRKLPSNWDSNGAEPPNPTAISRLESVLDLLAGVDLNPTKIVPSAEGGAAVCFIQGAKYADVECFNNGTLLAVLSTGRGTPEVWEIGPSGKSVRKTLERIRDFLRA